MKKHLFKILLFSSVILVSSCGSNTSQNSEQINFQEQSNYVVPYTSKTNEVGTSSKSYIVNRQQLPYLVMSSELRLDILITADAVTDDELDDYFHQASNAGLNTLELPIMWSMIETEENVFNFTRIETILDIAKSYDLRLNMLWYGSFTDGETRTANLPNYIKNDTVRFPLIADLFDYANFGRVRIMDWTNASLLAKEQYALFRLMNYVYEWNELNNNYDPVVMVQIGQGLDRFPRWRITQYEIMGSDNLLMATSEGWQLVNHYIEAMSKAVKYSSYRALTRVDFTEQNAVVNYVNDIKNIPNVDIVSPTYLHTIANAKSGIRSFQESFSNMPIINAQNWADDNNHKNLLASFALGATGFVSYQLSAARYFPEPPNGALFNRYDNSKATLDEKITPKGNRVTNLNGVLQGLTNGYVDIAKTVRNQFVVLGMDNRLSANAKQFVYTQNGLLVEYSNPVGGLGFVSAFNNYVLVYSLTASTITFENASFVTATKGYYDGNGAWTNEGLINLADNKTLELEQGTLYRLRASSINPLPTIIDSKYVGPLDAIRG